MHESVTRLLQAAAAATANLPPSRRLDTEAKVRKHLDVTSGAFTNWKSRGVSKQGLLDAEKAFGRSASWIETGVDDACTFPQHLSAGVSINPVAQEVSQYRFKLAPRLIPWEQIMIGPLDAEFQTEVPDASMAPDIPVGSRIMLITGVEPMPGDFVLVRDHAGHLYLREFRQLRPGHWQAHARNDAFLPLDSTRDGLKVVAVFDGMRGRRSKG